MSLFAIIAEVDLHNRDFVNGKVCDGFGRKGRWVVKSAGKR